MCNFASDSLNFGKVRGFGYSVISYSLVIQWYLKRENLVCNMFSTAPVVSTCDVYNECLLRIFCNKDLRPKATK